MVQETNGKTKKVWISAQANSIQPPSSTPSEHVGLNCGCRIPAAGCEAVSFIFERGGGTHLHVFRWFVLCCLAASLVNLIVDLLLGAADQRQNEKGVDISAGLQQARPANTFV
jgi:hypothetical protein